MPTHVAPLKVLSLLRERILIVEDSPILQEFMVETLRRKGYRVEIADDGWEGLTRFRAGVFDLVVTDHDMPKMTGAEMAAAIKSLAPEVPIIMIAGTPAGRSTVLPEGVDFFIPKPCRMTQLYAAVEGALNAHPGIGTRESSPQFANGC